MNEVDDNMILEDSYAKIMDLDLQKKKEVLKHKKYSESFLRYLLDVNSKLSTWYNDSLSTLSENAKYIYQDRYFITYTDGSKDISPMDVWRRVARSITSADTYYTNDIELLRLEEQTFYNLLSHLLFLPNSPILFNIGKGIEKSYFSKDINDMSYEDYVYVRVNQKTKNTSAACFVLEVDDNLRSIMDVMKDIAIISGAGGGIGLNFSKLRPEYSNISSGGYSSGAISFLKTYNALGENILEGGIRRFAGMAILGHGNLSDPDFYKQPTSFHPDIEDFIYVKHNNNGTSELRNFNISVGLNNTSDFVSKVDNNEDVKLEFEHKTLAELVSSDFNEKIYSKLSDDRKKVIATKVEGKINAKKLFDEIVDNAYKTGDPGFVFLDKANKYNPLAKYIQITSTNPCGERPNLSSSKYDMITPCNLASIDVSKFFTNGSFNFDYLFYVSQLITHFLDLSIDLLMFPLDSIKKGVLLLRDNGLGFAGLHGALILNNLAYDSDDGREFAHYIMKTIEVGATAASFNLAKLKYPFLASELADDTPRAEIWSTYDEPKKFTSNLVESQYQKLFSEPQLNSKLRNISLTSVAPTGTISQLLQSDSVGDVGAGVEPIFALKYNRFVLNKDGVSKTKVSYFTKLLDNKISDTEELAAVKDYVDKNNTVIGVEKALKHSSINYQIFKTALEINYIDHLKMLESIQSACSSSVSKTINLVKTATKKDVATAFMFAMKSPVIKGVTIYRDGSLETQVLNADKKDDKKDSLLKLSFDTKGKIMPKERPLIMETLKQRVSIKNGKEITFYVELGLDTNNEPFEVFIRSTNSSSEYTSLFNAIGRLTSLAFRSNISVDEVIKQIKKVKDWNNEYTVITNIIADTINSLINISKNKGKKRAQSMEEINVKKQNWKLVSEGYYVDEEGKMRCPICGSELVKQEGCITCNTCGWSACS